GLAVGHRVQDFHQRAGGDPVPDCETSTARGVSGVVVQSAPNDLLPLARCAALLTPRRLKSESGCSDPKWPATPMSRKRPRKTPTPPLVHPHLRGRPGTMRTAPRAISPHTGKESSLI